ncbi:hypothetical protein BDW22DRAFT_994620 [Trametopsis cervina]|nr:hypothetical protein BDW22DRAFT_994620 [Trametopsis cervina]
MNSKRPSPSPPPADHSRHARLVEEQHMPPMIPPRQPPTLPSIHHLHPELASSSQMTHPIASNSAHIGTSYHMSESTREYGARHGTDNSDAEGDPPGPPKKKRRRQALSCTECKRRKIKCDRAQPCGPCSRRGEQSKCQWHIIEPMEKYVMRTEYDELKARVEHLEEVLSRTVSGVGNPSPPSVPLHSSRDADASPSTSRAPYPIHSSPSHAGYRDVPSSFSPVRGEPPPPPASALPHPVAPRSPTYPAPPYAEYSGRPATALPSLTQSTRALSTSPILTSSSRLRGTDTRAPGSRRASLSLAAITTPYVPDSAAHASQSKNRHAQTLPLLGQRLRQASALTGPATGVPRQSRKGTHTHTAIIRRTTIKRTSDAVHLAARRLRLRRRAINQRRRHLQHRHLRDPSVVEHRDICLGSFSATDSYPSATIASHITYLDGL